MPDIGSTRSETTAPPHEARARVADESRPRESGVAILRGLLRIGAFLLLVAGIAWSLDGAISGVLRRASLGSYAVWNNIVEGRINADIVVSGSSRALTHYDPRVLEKAVGRSTYNIGLNGSQSDLQLARFKTYLRHNRNPVLLIQNLDAFSFQVTHGEVYDPGQYLPYLAEPELYEALVRINPDTWRWRYIPLYGYAKEDMRFGWVEGLFGWATGRRVDESLRGFEPRHLTWTDDFSRFRALHPNGVHVDVEPDGVQQIEEMLQLCATRGIKVVLVYSPELVEMQVMTSNRSEIFGRFADMSRRYGAALLDFSDSPISKRKELFYNSQHLNAEGAREFSEELAERLRGIDEAGLGKGASRRE